jgi:hypothetical protein
MSKECNEFHKCDLGDRWSQFLREQYNKPHAAKLIAGDFDCAVRTARGWLDGNTPGIKQVLRAASLFGVAAVADLLFPDTDYSAQTRLIDDLSALKDRLEAMENRIRRLSHDQSEDGDGM